MRKAYEEPDFELITFSFESILEEPTMSGSDPEGKAAAEGWD